MAANEWAYAEAEERSLRMTPCYTTFLVGWQNKITEKYIFIWYLIQKAVL